jgi:sulfur-carrier protein adenylyltransferase/sulfurtransferase
VDVYNEPFTSANAMRIARSYDLHHRRHRQLPHPLPDQRCVRAAGQAQRVRLDLPLRWAGQRVRRPRGPCYRCLFPEPPPPGLVPSCAEGGVLGVLPGTIGTLQATEALKLILGIGEPLIGRLLLYNALDMSFEFVKLKKNPKCKVCGPNPISPS